MLVLELNGHVVEFFKVRATARRVAARVLVLAPGVPVEVSFRRFYCSAAQVR